MKKKDDVCFIHEQTSNATTIFSSSATTTSPTLPTNSADTSFTTNSIPQYQKNLDQLVNYLEQNL